MLAKKATSILLVTVLIICAMTTILFATESTNKAMADIVIGNGKANIQNYVTEEGEDHTIYWAQGIDAPKMTGNPDEFGKPGFFEKNVETYKHDNRRDEVYVNYDSVMEDGKGYYDLNKNRTSFHCYLAASTNIIHWWLDQNSSYVATYIDRLKNTNIYSQPSGLRRILPFNETMWNEMTKAPTLEYVSTNDKYSQELYNDLIVKNYLSVYNRKEDDGYWTNLVWDHFFNGYPSIVQVDIPLNNEEDYRMDPMGGFFFPIFGTHQLTESYRTSKYSDLNKAFKEKLTNGYGATLSFIGARDAHAITIWGAEYDTKGDLARLYYTDSDDMDAIDYKTRKVYGMRSYDVNVNSKGIMYISNDINLDTSLDKQGALVIGADFLSLGDEIWQERMADTNDPSAPTIDRVSDDMGFTLTSKKDELFVDIVKNEYDTIMYQWYEATSENGDGNPIAGAKYSRYTPDISKEGTRYYYAVATRYKNGKRADTRTRNIKVLVDNNVVDADTPRITFDNSTKYYQQYDTPYKIKVTATVDEGELTYQWYGRSYGDNRATDGIKLVGETSNTLIPATDKPGNMYYYCEITNTNMSATGAKSVTVTTPSSKRIVVKEVGQLLDAKQPNIIKNIDNVKVNKGDALTLSVDAKSVDGGILSYQWYVEDYYGAPATKIVGATSNSYVIDTGSVSTKYYYVEITNTNDKATRTKTSTISSVLAEVDIVSTASSDNTLTSLSLANATLNEKFSPSMTNYTANIPHSVTSLVVNATTAVGARYDIIDNNIAPGATVNVIIRVTAENGATRDYTITATRSNEHEYGDWITTKEPTCTEIGKKERHCLYCDHVEYADIGTIEHEYTVTVVPPTCTEQGYTLYTCKNCGYSYKRDVVNVKGHNYVTTVVPPTCTEQGYTLYTCSVCHDEYRDNYVEALGHDFDTWQLVSEPTCLTPGEMRHTCVREGCNYSESQSIDAYGHEYEVVVTKPTCTEQGYTTHTCIRGDHVYVDNYVEPLGHSFGDWIIDREPTCTVEGSRHRLCANCNLVIMEAIPTTQHNYEIAYDDTHHFLQCTLCGEKKDIALHSYGEWIVDRDATLDAPGERHRTCSCGYVDRETLPALKHNYVTKFDDEYHWQECETCGDIINKKKHALQFTVDRTPTCTVEGLRHGDCECGYHREESIPTIEHSFGSWQVVTPPTCVEDGIAKRICTACGHEETQPIPKTGHTYIEVITPPTCTEEGYTTHTCEKCGDSFVDNKVSPLGHLFGDWVVVKEPTYEEEGLREKTCSVCGEKISESIPRLTTPEVKPEDKPTDQETKPDDGLVEPETKPVEPEVPTIKDEALKDDIRLKVGLGVGIPAGLILIIGLIIFFVKRK